MEELVVIQKSELINLIREAVKEELKAISMRAETTETMSCTQAAAFVGKGTTWVKKLEREGYLQNYGTIGKHLYRRDELLLCVKMLSNKTSAVESEKIREELHQKTLHRFQRKPKEKK